MNFLFSVLFCFFCSLLVLQHARGAGGAGGSNSRRDTPSSGGSGSGSGSSSTSRGFITTQVLQTITEPLLWKYGAAGAPSSFFPPGHEARMQSVYKPSRNSGRRKTGREHVEDRGILLPLQDGEEIRFTSPNRNSGTSRVGNESQQNSSRTRTNRENLQSKYVSLYNYATISLPEDVPKDVLNQHFYDLVEQHHAKMARVKRAGYLSKKVGGYLTAQEADEVRDGFFDVRQRIENVYDPERSQTRLEQTMTTNKSRLKRKLLENPNDEKVKESIQRLGYTVEELMARRSGRKRKDDGLSSSMTTDANQQAASEEPSDHTPGHSEEEEEEEEEGYDTSSTEVKGGMQSYQSPPFRLDLNKPAPMDEDADEED